MAVGNPNRDTAVRITAEVFGKQKLAARVYPFGIGVLVRAIGGEYIIPTQQLMAIPAFRESVKAILASESDNHSQESKPAL